jgi:hypothetical protein
MEEFPLKGPEDEQSICITCGYCCDGTLFMQAHLNPGERGYLPLRIEENSYSDGESDYFKLPCLYFSEKCTIYDKKRADICSGYRCQLLKDFAGEKMTIDDALNIVREAGHMLEDIFTEYRHISGDDSEMYFRNLLQVLGRIQKRDEDEEPLLEEYETLLAKCNIFEALLIKNFRSAGDFDKMKIDK